MLPQLKRYSLILLNIVVLTFFLIVVAGIYLWVVRKTKGQLIFPAGINYLSPNKNAVSPASLYDFAKLAESADWLTYKGKIYPYSFQYPKEFKPVSYPNNDAVTFQVYNTIPPERNLLFLVETISARDSSLVGKPEEFVHNYWKFFSGLKGVKEVTPVKNEKSLQGFKATYSVNSGGFTSDNYFFIIDGDSDHMLHIANIFGADGTVLFKRIINSLDYKK